MRVLLAFALCAAGCFTAGPPMACTPGAQSACSCGGGLQGFQVCKDDGSGLGPCMSCGSPFPDASTEETPDLSMESLADLSTTSEQPDQSVIKKPLTLDFAPQVEYANPGNNPQMLVAGDIDGDGKADLAAPNRDSTNISLFINAGTGTFKPGTVTNLLGSFGESLAIGDMNKDGKPDLVAGLAPSAVAVLINQGNGSFVDTSYPLNNQTSAYAVTLGNFNGDGQLDVALTEVDPVNDVVVMLNGGGGLLTAPVHYTVGKNPYGIAAGDFDHDGTIDLVATDRDLNQISLLANTGNGQFKPAMSYGVGNAQQPWEVAAADFDGDGKTDFVTGDESMAVSIFLGKNLGAPVVYPAGATETITAATGDFNADGLPDVAALGNGDSVITILLNQGNGVMKPAPNSYPVVGATAYVWLAAADFNSDGKSDLAVSSNGTNKIYVLLNTSK